MDIIFHSMQSILSIVIMMFLGIMLARAGWFDEKASRLIADLVTKVSLPCLILLNITDNFARENLGRLFSDMALPVLSVVASYFIGSALCKLLKVPKGRRALFKAMFYVANCIYIGVPLNIALFGEDSTVYIFEYFAANTTALWCVAVYQLSVDGADEEMKMDVLQTVKRILYSPLAGFLTALILVLLDVKLPVFAKDTLKYIGSMTTPLSMIFVGIELNKTKLNDLKMNLEMFVAHIGKFVVGPAIMFAFHDVVSTSDLHFKVMVIQASTPVAVALPLLAARYGVDVKYAAILTSTSTILFIFVVPFYMWLLHLYLGK